MIKWPLDVKTYHEHTHIPILETCWTVIIQANTRLVCSQSVSTVSSQCYNRSSNISNYPLHFTKGSEVWWCRLSLLLCSHKSSWQGLQLRSATNRLFARQIVQANNKTYRVNHQSTVKLITLRKGANVMTSSCKGRFYSETTWAVGIAHLTHHEVQGGGKNPETEGHFQVISVLSIFNNTFTNLHEIITMNRNQIV